MASILMVSDNSAEIMLFREALADANVAAELVLINDYEQARHYLEVKASQRDIPPPNLIVIDVPYPPNGYADLIEYMDNSPPLSAVPRLALMANKQMIARARHPASLSRAFVEKPIDWDGYIALAKHIRELLDR